MTCDQSLHRFVGIFISRKDRLRDMGLNPRFTNVYIKNFGDDFTDTKLREAFEKFGPIVSAIVMTDKTGRSMGFGFVSYETHEHAATVSGWEGGRESSARGILVACDSSALCVSRALVLPIYCLALWLAVVQSSLSLIC